MTGREVALAKRIWVWLTEFSVIELEIKNESEAAVKRACLALAADLLGIDGERDLIFEALCEAMGHDWKGMAHNERAKYNVATRQLREIYAEPAEVLVRAKRYRQQHPDWDLTPTALVNHWSSLSKPTTQKLSAQVFSPEPDSEPEDLVTVTPEMVAEQLERLASMAPNLPQMYD